MLKGSTFRQRGIEVVVDTIQPAEFDRQGYQIADSRWDKIANNLKTTPVSDRDRVVGNVRIRELENYDIVYILTRDGPQMVVTIIRVCLPNEANPTEQLVEKLGPIAIIRGVTGL